MSKMKDLQITIDDARELVEKFGKEHTDVTVEIRKVSPGYLFCDVIMRDTLSYYGMGYCFDVRNLNECGISYLENKLNDHYQIILNHRNDKKLSCDEIEHVIDELRKELEP
jgi:hypothetical protein